MELIIVIAVIAILVALLLPALGIASFHAKQAKATISMAGIQSAITSSITMYGRLPNTGTSAIIVNSGTLFVNFVLGIDKNLNPRGVPMLDIPTKELFGPSGSQIWIDPFGRNAAGAYLPYAVFLDTNDDGGVDSNDASSPVVPGGRVQRKAFTYSAGKNRQYDNGSGDDIVTGN